MRFRKKPLVIEAEQWFRGVHIEGLKDCVDPWGAKVDHCRAIETLEGRMTVSEGDWVITGINGEKYPCKPDVFTKTYDPI